MRHLILSAVLLAACDASGQLPPPATVALTLEVGDLIEGRPVTFTASGLQPGEQVWFAASQELDPSAPFACPWPAFDCLDLHLPVARIGRATADANGVATHVATVPLGAGVRTAHVQAANRTARSPVLTVDVSLVDPETTIVLASQLGAATGLQAVDLGLTPSVLVDATAGIAPSVRALTDGPDGRVYGLGFTGDLFSGFDPRTGLVEELPIGNDPGWRVDLTNLPGDSRIFVLREVNGDRLAAWDTVTQTWEPHLLSLGGFFDSPRAMTDGPDGRLWAMDQLGRLQAFTVSPPGRQEIADLDQPGTYEDLTNLVGTDLLYLLRDTGTGSAIDTFDVTTGAYVPDVVVLPGIRSAGDQRNVLTDTNDGRLVVAGEPDLVIVDPHAGTITPLPATLAGTVMGVTNLDP